jgi:DEAD/DEAH box helicase domain-containing protein
VQRSDGRGQALLQRLLASADGESPLRHVVTIPAQTATTVPWPCWVPVHLREAFRRAGIAAPWTHQVAAAELARAGYHVVVATGTASGKSLAYQLPVLADLLADQQATALYLAPTKALGADQLRAVSALGLSDVRAAGYDGDTPMG